jgi:hypothetical protein
MTYQYRPDVDLIMVSSARLGKLKSWLAREAGLFAVTLPYGGCDG